MEGLSVYGMIKIIKYTVKEKMEKQKTKIAYFSMEFAFEKKIPNYAGGLGVLAADTIYSLADLNIEAVGVSLIYHQSDSKRKGFDPSPFMKKLNETIKIQIENREVDLAIWQMDISGKNGHIVPVFFLSSYLPENPRWDRDLTKHLYDSQTYTRLCQEALLGIGGVRALDVLGYEIENYHLNEGHASLATTELLRKTYHDPNEVKKICSFTTHTPVPAGHDHFSYELAFKTLPKDLPQNIREYASSENLSMTQLALSLSGKTNAVSHKHREVCQKMFPNFQFEAITNGIYHPRWVGDEINKLLNKHLPGWSQEPSLLKKAIEILPDKELVEARVIQKENLIKWLNSNKNFFPFDDFFKDDNFTSDRLTLGFARRVVPYKRPDLIFRKIEKLRRYGYKKLQFIFAGKCHPEDNYCNNIIEQLRGFARALRGQIRIAIIPDYNIEISKKMLTGCDAWLNNPISPREASGTSGMKSALNGGLNISALDGWWVEAFEYDQMAGWGFNSKEEFKENEDRDDYDANELLYNLKDAIDCYYERNNEWNARMKHAIAQIAYFNTHRMCEEYSYKIWQRS